MIPNKFLFYKTEAGFLADLNNKLISDNSIVLVKEGPFFYTHGVKFNCSITPEYLNLDFIEYFISSSMSEINSRIDDSERVLADVIGSIRQGSLINGKPVIGNSLEISKSDLGLENIDNTKDLDKPISNAVNGELVKLREGKLDKSFTINGHTLTGLGINLTKEDLGLGNVDNTRDLDKPVSTETQREIDTLQKNIETKISEIKEDLVHGLDIELIEYFISSSMSEINSRIDDSERVLADVIGSIRQGSLINGKPVIGNSLEISKSDLGLENIDNTKDLDKPISTETQRKINTLREELTKGLSFKVNSTEVLTYNGTGDRSINLVGGSNIILSVTDDGNIVVSGEADLGEIGYWMSKCIGDLREDMELNSKTTATAINDLRKQIIDLQNEIRKLQG